MTKQQTLSWLRDDTQWVEQQPQELRSRKQVQAGDGASDTWHPTYDAPHI